MKIFFIGLLIFIVCALKGWDGSLLDFQAFRQTQTAITASSLLNGGNWLAYETPVFGPPWSIPLEFPLYQWTAAVIVKTGIFSLDQAGRFVSILFFLLALYPINKILEALGIVRRERAVILALICLSPQYIFWSRAFMIESTALALSSCYLWLVILFFNQRHETPKRALILIGITVTGVLAGVVKATTFFAFFAGAMLFTAVWIFKNRKHPVRGSWSSSALFFTGAMVVPVAAIAGWTLYADSLKRLNPIGDLLTSTSQREWYFSAFTQIRSLAVWKHFFDRTLKDLIGGGFFLVLSAGLAYRCRPGRINIAAVSLLLFLLPLLVFTKLHFVHNYYAYANGIFLIAAVGIIIADLSYSDNQLSKALGIVLFLALVTGSMTHYFRTYWPEQGQAYRFEDMKADSDKYTFDTDVLVIFGDDWSPGIPYYLDRRAVMFPDWAMSEKVYAEARDNVLRQRVGAVLFCWDKRNQSDFINKMIVDFKLEYNSLPVRYSDCDAFYNTAPRGYP